MKKIILPAAFLFCSIFMAAHPVSAGNVQMVIPSAETAPVTLAPENYPLQPALFRYTNGKATVYLYGSIHSLPKNVKWRNSAFNTAVGLSDKIWLESTLQEMANPALQIDQLLSMRNEQIGLDDILTPQQMAKLTKVANAQHLDIAEYNNLHPWVVSDLLQGAKYKTDKSKDKKNEIKSVAGVEKTIIDMRMGKPILALENTRRHVMLFSQLSQEDEIALLMNTVDHIDMVQKDKRDEIVTQWRTGDLDAIAKEAVKMKAETPGLYKYMLELRNREMADGIIKMMQKNSGTNFVAVGALHLPGEDGVLTLMEKAGYKAERIYDPEEPVASGNTYSNVKIPMPHYRTDLHVPHSLTVSLRKTDKPDTINLHFVWPIVINGCAEISPIKTMKKVYDDSIDVSLVGYLVNIHPYPNTTGCGSANKYVTADIPLDVNALKKTKKYALRLATPISRASYELDYEDGTATLIPDSDEDYFRPDQKNLSVTGL